MTVRTFLKEDIAKIVTIENACFSDAWNEEAFAAVCRYPVLHGLVIEEDGEVVGYCCTQVVFEDAELQNIAVTPTMRGRGYATKLLTAAEEHAKTLGAEKCFLEVRCSNAPAIGLYKKFGYEEIGVRKGYYGDGEDAIVMTKTL